MELEANAAPGMLLLSSPLLLALAKFQMGNYESFCWLCAILKGETNTKSLLIPWEFLIEREPYDPSCVMLVPASMAKLSDVESTEAAMGSNYGKVNTLNGVR